MRAMDVMTANVFTVGPDTSVQDLTRLLSERGISGVPVLDSEERLVGIVTEGDLLHRAETGTDPRPAPRRAWWPNTIAKKDDLARDYVKSHGRTVKDIMTTDVVSVTDTTSSRMSQSCSRRNGSSASRSSTTARSLVLSAGRTSCGHWRR